MGVTISATALVASLSLSSLAAHHPHAPDTESAHDHYNGQVHENGIGPDPDRDTNPATDTRIIPFVGEWRTTTGGDLYPIVQFEPPPGKHAEPIRKDFAAEYGVTFGPGLSWQVCDGHRHFQYDSMCTYEAPTSGKFAAGYLDYLNRPLEITFDEPVCIVTMSIYPTGAKDREPFEFTIEGWDEYGRPLEAARETFEWKKETVRWNNVAGAYFVGAPAKKITVAMRSADSAEAGKTLRYLIDDLAFLSQSCDAAVDDIEKRTGLELRSRILKLNREENTIDYEALDGGEIPVSASP
ncbi:MAG: hypothetical protein AAGD92_04005 [Pseudomonadota bacterium]